MTFRADGLLVSPVIGLAVFIPLHPYFALPRTQPRASLRSDDSQTPSVVDSEPVVDDKTVV